MSLNNTKHSISKQWLLFVALFYLLLFRDPLEQKIGVIKYADELIALCAVPIFILRLTENHYILRRKKRDSDYGLWLVLFIICGLVGNVVYQYQPFMKTGLPDFIVNLKFWFSMYVGGFVFRKLDMEENSGRVFRHIRFLTCFFVAMIAADYVLHIFPTEIRYGLRSTTLFYSHPTAFAANSVLVITMLLSIRDYVGRKIEPYLLVWLLLLSSTLRSKAIGAAMAIALVYYFAYIRKKKIQISTLLIFVPLLILLAWDQIQYYFFSDIQNDSARYQLLVKSFEIANDHFPFGTGFGTFASHHSTTVYSPLYKVYNLSHINGLVEGEAHFVSDSFWPMVLGQNGWLGLAAFMLVLWCLYKKIQRIRQFSRGFYAAALSILAYVLIASTAESAFVHPLMVPLALWLGNLLYQAQRGIQATSRTSKKVG